MAVLEKLSFPGVPSTLGARQEGVLRHLRQHFRAFENPERLQSRGGKARPVDGPADGSADLASEKIGIELEYPVLRLSGQVPDWVFLKDFLTAFGNKYGLKTLVEDCAGRAIQIQNQFGDVLSYEFTYGMLEFSLAPRGSLHEIHADFKNLFTLVRQELARQDHFLAGIGVHPYSWKGELPIVEHAYYQMTYHYLGQLKSYAPEDSQFNAWISSTQVHLDVDSGTLPRFLTVMDELQWMKLLFFSNSPSCFGNPFSQSPDLCVRDLYWSQSAFAKNPRNVGGLEKPLHRYEDVLEAESQKAIFRVIRGGVPIYFEPLRLSEFLAFEQIVGTAIVAQVGAAGNLQFALQEQAVQPDPKDLAAFRAYTHTAITSRGTVEVRSECQQPLSSVLAPSAFNLGVLHNLEKIAHWLDGLHKYWHCHSPSLLRRKAASVGFQMSSPFANRSLEEALTQLLDLSAEGLKSRGFGEERFLDPLYERVRKKTNPAIEWMEGHQSGRDLLCALKASGELL